MKTCTAPVIAAALWICGAPPNLEQVDGPIYAASAAERTKSEFKSWKDTKSPSVNRAERAWMDRQRDQRLRVMKKTDRDAILWGNESKPNGSIVLELNPRLEKANGADVVEIEVFSTFIDDDGFTELQCRARELALGTWWPSIEQSGAPVRLDYRQVDQGPGLDSRYHESRRKIAELVVGGAWYAGNGDERGLEVVRGTMKRLRERFDPTRHNRCGGREEPDRCRHQPCQMERRDPEGGRDCPGRGQQQMEALRGAVS